MNFIRHHWFGMLNIFLILGCLFVFVLIIISPKQDLLKRGFIPCTENMANEIINCDQTNKIACITKAIVKNSWCDTKIIVKGAKNWLSGKQPKPWSNYIFEPELPIDENFDESAKEEYLKTNPSPQEEMEKLKLLNEELENEQQPNIIKQSEQPQ